MSLNSLASSRVARELPSTGAPRRTRSASEDSLGTPDRDVQNALSALVEYLPAETITLYLATIAALPAVQSGPVPLSSEAVYWVFALLTPILYALIYAGKRRGLGEPAWPGRSKAPWWPMIAATVAFLAWGLTVPNGPYLSDEGGRVLSGLLAIAVSTVLGVLGRVLAPTPA